MNFMKLWRKAMGAVATAFSWSAVVVAFWFDWKIGVAFCLYTAGDAITEMLAHTAHKPELNGCDCAKCQTGRRVLKMIEEAERDAPDF